jgi:hypothetical protein
MGNVPKHADACNNNSYLRDNSSNPWVEYEELRQLVARLVAVRFGVSIATAATIVDLAGIGGAP